MKLVYATLFILTPLVSFVITKGFESFIVFENWMITLWRESTKAFDSIEYNKVRKYVDQNQV